MVKQLFSILFTALNIVWWWTALMHLSGTYITIIINKPVYVEWMNQSVLCEHFSLYYVAFLMGKAFRRLLLLDAWEFTNMTIIVL